MRQFDSKFRYLASSFCEDIHHCNVFLETYQGCINLESAPKRYRDDENIIIDLHTLKYVHVGHDVISKMKKAEWQAWADSVTYNRPMVEPEVAPVGESESFNYADLASDDVFHFMIRLNKAGESTDTQYDYFVVQDIEECCQFLEGHHILPSDKEVVIIDLFHLYQYEPLDLYKIRYRLLGGIIGDTIGSIYEFDNIHTRDFPLFTEESEFTDDSVMTVAVA